VPIYGFSGTSSRSAKLRMFRDIVANVKPAIVHSYSFHTNFGVYWGTLGTDCIPLGGVRSDFDWARDRTGRILGRLNSRWPRHQVFNSSVAAAEIMKRRRSFFVPDQCLVVRNAVDLESFHNSALSQPSGTTQIIGIGSLYSIKRWDRVIALAVALKRRGLDFLIRIAGTGPLLDSLKAQAAAFGVNRNVQFIGHIDNVPAYLAQSAFAIHVSDREGCPNAVMESMASGRAVVATRVGDIPQILDDGKTGFVVACEDETTLVERTATLITDRDLCAAMGRAAREKAEREFGLDRLVKETLAAYHAAGWNS